jgi:hypothetical protein
VGTITASGGATQVLDDLIGDLSVPFDPEGIVSADQRRVHGSGRESPSAHEIDQSTVPTIGGSWAAMAPNAAIIRSSDAPE